MRARETETIAVNNLSFLFFFAVCSSSLLRSIAETSTLQTGSLYTPPEIDSDSSGSINVDEFLSSCDIELTPFSRRVFGIMDEDGNGEMDFREFVVATWNYCSFEKAGLTHFTYDLYDVDRSGSMSVDECKSMFVEVYGDSFMQANKGLKLFDTIERLAMEGKSIDVITLPQFTKLINTHVNVLIPAFQMQSAIQGRVLGRKFWSRIMSKRTRNMDAAEWKKHVKGHRKKLDTRAVLQGYREKEAEELLERLKRNYKSNLIGRLGKYNPQLDTERRKGVHKRSKVRICGNANSGRWLAFFFFKFKGEKKKKKQRQPFANNLVYSGIKLRSARGD